MPWESGERRHNSDDDDSEDRPETNRLDNPCECHDEGDSTLEWCLREYEETLTDHQSDDEEGPGQLVLGATESLGDTEETGLNSLDEDYPQETSAATHEADKGDELLAWSLGEYEDVMESPSTGTEATSEAVYDEEDVESRRDAHEPSAGDSSVSSDDSRFQLREDEVDSDDRAARQHLETQYGSGEPASQAETTRMEQENHIFMLDSSPTDGEATRAQNSEICYANGKEEGEIASRRDNEAAHSHEASSERMETVDLNTVTVHDAKVAGAGELVEEWRLDLGFSQYQLADGLDCDQSLVSYWESNKSSIPLEDLQQVAKMAGSDLELALRELQAANHGVEMEWKGEHYTIDSFIESIENPHATLNYSESQQTYFLDLNPMADVEFHRRDMVTALLEHDEVQAVGDLTAGKGTRANIRVGTVERMGVEPGDELDIHVLNVRGHDEPSWEPSIHATTSTSDEGTSIHLNGEFGRLGFDTNDGDYAKMVFQTDRGEGLVIGTIQDGAIRLEGTITSELLGEREAGSLTVKTDSIVISHTPFREEVELQVGVDGGVHIAGLLSNEGFTSPHGGETLRAHIMSYGEGSDARGEQRLDIRIDKASHEIFPPYSATEGGTTLGMKLENMVILNAQNDQTQHGPMVEGSYTPAEKSMMGSELFDALTRHMGAETLYQVETPNQGGIDRIIERDGNIILVEEKAEHAYGISWRTANTMGQVVGYMNSFHELAESNSDLSDKLNGREPTNIEIWTTARVPRDNNGEIDPSRIQLYDPSLQRNLKEGEAATLRIRSIDRDGAIYSDIIPGVPYTISVGENDEIIFSVQLGNHALEENHDEGKSSRVESSTLGTLEIRVRHHDHVQAACEDINFFDEDTRNELNDTLTRVERRIGGH